MHPDYMVSGCHALCLNTLLYVIRRLKFVLPAGKTYTVGLWLVCKSDLVSVLWLSSVAGAEISAYVRTIQIQILLVSNHVFVLILRMHHCFV